MDRSFTCTLFWPFKGKESFEAVPSDAEGLKAYFTKIYPDAVCDGGMNIVLILVKVPLLTNLVEDYQTNPIGSLMTVKCAPWHVDGKVYPQPSQLLF